MKVSISGYKGIPGNDEDHPFGLIHPRTYFIRLKMVLGKADLVIKDRKPD